MTTRERIDVRAAIQGAGFDREYSLGEPKNYDSTGTEEWRSKKDRTKIIIEWDKKNE